VSTNLITSTEQHTEEISKCHLRCFKNSLSSQLGLAYTKKTFEWFLKSKNRFLFHVVSDGKVVGYCGGFMPQYIGEGSTSGIMQYTMRQAFTGGLLHPWLLFHKEVMALYPLIFKNIVKKMFPKKHAAADAETVKPFDKRVGLVVIGVDPQFRGSGIFQLLMHEFEARAISFNIHKLVLSVRKNNARAIKAYTKQGWFVTKEHLNTQEMCKYLQ